MMAVVEARPFRACEVQALAYGAIAASLMSVQNDEMEIEVLTWAVMGSSVDQA